MVDPPLESFAKFTTFEILERPLAIWFTMDEAVSIPWGRVWGHFTGQFRPLVQIHLELQETITILKRLVVII